MGKAKISSNVKSRTCILVLGMHRSGTSALAGVLSKLGCEVPAHQMAPSRSNEKGFFESTAVRDFNEELLTSAGSSWDDLTPFHEEWLHSPSAPAFLDRAVSVLEKELGNAQLFVLKDPRICRLVPFWMEALGRFGCTVKPVLTIRNPLEVGHSLVTKKNFSEPVGQMLWLRHALDAERATRGMVRFHTSFEELMRSWEDVAQRMQDGLQLVWPKPVASVEFEVAAFLSGELRHHRESNDRALTSSLLPDWLRESYDILRRWAVSGETEADYAQLDRIRVEFDAASRAFGRLVSAERAGSVRYRERADELQQALTSLQEQGAASKKTLEEALTASEARSAALQGERSALQEQAAGLEKQLEERATALEKQLEDQAAASRIEREALKSELQGAVKAEREAMQARLADAASEFALQRTAFDEELEALKAEAAKRAAEAEQRISEVTRSLQEERRRKTLMDAELHQLQEARQALEAELAASQARRKEAARVIDRQKSDLAARYQELAALERQILRQSPSWWAAQSVKRVKRIFKAPGKKAYS